MSTYYLAHHGVKGMKWGVRKAEKERVAYKVSKRNLRSLEKEYKKTSGWGIEGIAKKTAIEGRVVDASVKKAHAEAKYRAAKAKNADKANKSEFKSYVKSMSKTGLVNSDADRLSGGRSAKLYKSLVTSKGKEYADRVQKKVQSRTVAAAVASVAATVGASIVLGILEANNS